MAEQKTTLSPRETAMRMLLHVEDEVSYEDIIRQLRILQQIDRTIYDQQQTSGLEEVMPDASPEPFASRSQVAGTSRKPAFDDLEGPEKPEFWPDDATEMQNSGSKFSAPFEMESADHAPFPSGLPSLVLRSRPLYSWRTLAERSDDRSDAFLASATWIY